MGLLVVSPHCDDAVFGAGDLITAHPGTAVATVFTAGPPDDDLRPWDRDCGFAPGDDVMRARREEDRAALQSLGARPIWLPFRDDQYGCDADVDTITRALTGVIADTGASTIAVPLGLFHRDHMLVHEAALAARAMEAAREWLAYEDAIYRRFPRDLVGARLARLREAGIAAEPASVPTGVASDRKRRAIACYRSQLRGLTASGRIGYADAFEPEGYWRLA